MDSDEQKDHMSSFRETRRQLPVRKESLVQQGSGILDASATVVPGPEATLYFAHVGTQCSTLAELDNDYTGFVLPLSWREDFYINGEQVDTSSIYMPVDGDLFLVHGWERDTVATALLRNDLIATIAALRGVDPDDIKLDEGTIEVPSAVAASARYSIAKILATYNNQCNNKTLGKSSSFTDKDLTTRILSILTDLYLQALPIPQRKLRQSTKLGRIIRKAEECFEAAKPEPISLADLCAAASVSQGTLYHAFGAMCGATPMAHFRNRRLTDARLALLNANPTRGAVKLAAFNQGLSHLGRFSEEYHNLFGEHPRVTLTKR